MSNPWSTAIEIAEAGAKLIGTIVGLIDRAINGDEDALSKLKRVDQVLSPTSPTGNAFKRAGDIAAGKPSRDDTPTTPLDVDTEFGELE